MKWPVDPEARRRMVEAVLTWVEELDRAEPEPEGVAPEAAGEVPDLLTTVASLEALRTEVGLQGRAFERLAARAEADAAAKREVEPPPDPAEREARGRRTGVRDTAIRLIEARERFDRLHDSARRLTKIMASGPFRAARRREAFGALVEGLRLALESTDEALRDLDCHEIGAEGERFDGMRMRAVEKAEPEEGEPGRVVAVRRSGWLMGDDVVRPAEVRAVPEEA